MPDDVTGFLKKPHETGWQFKGLPLIRESRVVYKLSSGQPNPDRYDRKVRPLGARQELDSLLLRTGGSKSVASLHRSALPIELVETASPTACGELKRHQYSAMNHEHWNFWQQPRQAMSESVLLRYGIALILPAAAATVIFVRPVFTEAPLFVFLGAIVLSAANGGLAPAFLSIALSALLIRLFFVHPNGSLHYGADFAGMERMAGFVLVSMLLSSFVAAIRRERNQLRDSEERYRMLAETASDAIIVIDEKGEILYVNPVAEKIFGSRARELLGRNLALLLPGDGYHAKLTEMKHHLDSRKKAVAVQLPGLHQSGEHLLVEMTLGTSSHRGRDLFTAIIRDITGHKR